MIQQKQLSRSIGLALLLLLSSCTLFSGISSVEEHRFVLEDIHCSSPSSKEKNSSLLFIENTTAPSSLNSTRILFSRKSYEEGFYQYSFWSAPIPEQLRLLLFQRLQCTKGFTVVQKNYVTTPPQYIVSTELTEFHHDSSSQPGEAVASLVVTLRNNSKKKEVRTKSFSQRAPAQSYNAEGAVKAFNQATYQLLEEVAQWIEKEVAKGQK